MSPSFFVSTPIYYSNGIPHIGHAYASLVANVIMNYKKMQGYDVKFSTGVDENSQKVVESAQSHGMEIMEYADMMASHHRAVWDGLGIQYTDFIRTTEDRHRIFVQEMLMRSYENGDIYEGVYEGKYCVGCEAFKKESDLVRMIDGKKVEHGGVLGCPDHPNKPITELREKNYFFRLSRYQDRLLEFYDRHRDFIIPSNRFNEVKEFVRGGLEDFSVSRETNRFGIPLPFDASQVTYVWYDALFNYLTVCQGEEERWWPNTSNNAQVLHIIGKEISRFHAIYWPAMLWSAGYDAPSHLLVTGFFTVDGQKMSKSIGNTIDPVSYIEQYSKDQLLLYLLQAFPLGEDGDFDRGEAIRMYNAKLANNIGNLLHRFTTLVSKFGGKITGEKSELDASSVTEKYLVSMEKYDLKNALQIVFHFADAINIYLAEQEPWKIRGEDSASRNRIEEILYTVGSGLRNVAIMLLPFFSEKMELLLSRIGSIPPPASTFQTLLDAQVTEFRVTERGDPLYVRVEEKDT